MLLPSLSFPLIGVVGTMSLVITLPGASQSKAYMFAPCGSFEAMVPVKQESLCIFWRFLSIPRGHSAVPVVIWACSHIGHLPYTALVDVTILGLLYQRLLAQARSCRGG